MSDRTELLKRLEKVSDLELENKRLRDAFAMLAVMHDEAEENGESVSMTTRLVNFDIAILRRDAVGVTWVGLGTEDFAKLKSETVEEGRFRAPMPDGIDELSMYVPGGLLRVTPVAGLPRGVIAQLRDPLVVRNYSTIHSLPHFSRDAMAVTRCDFKITPMQAIRHEVS